MLKKIVLIVTIGFVVIQLYQNYHSEIETFLRQHNVIQSSESLSVFGKVESRFHCDARQYCSQMTSYDEAVYFLEHCPNTKMDGDRDGIPCERQFGKH